MSTLDHRKPFFAHSEGARQVGAKSALNPREGTCDLGAVDYKAERILNALRETRHLLLQERIVARYNDAIDLPRILVYGSPK